MQFKKVMMVRIGTVLKNASAKEFPTYLRAFSLKPRVRAMWGARAIMCGNPDAESNRASDEIETVVIDTVANIRHFCAMTGLDWETVARISEGHFEAEKEDGRYQR